MYSWSVSGTFNEVLIGIAEGYTIDTDPVVCGDEEEWENLRKEKKANHIPSDYCCNKTFENWVVENR